jgi:hypothetical protein
MTERYRSGRNYDQQISHFQDALAALDVRLAKLAEQRNAHAIDAASGNEKASAAIDKIDVEAAEARRERATLTAAIALAEGQRAEAEARAAEADRKKHETDARKLADAVLAVDAEIDVAMPALADLLRKRAELLRQLTLNVTVSPQIGHALQHGFAPSIAANHHGLSNHINLVRIRSPFHSTLAHADRLLTGRLTAPSQQAAETEVQARLAKQRARDRQILQQRVNIEFEEITRQANIWAAQGDRNAAARHRGLLDDLPQRMCRELGIDPALIAEITLPQESEAA